MSGAIAYTGASPAHVARLRNDITSPGGTSAEAIYELEKAGVRVAFMDAVKAADRRSRELESMA